MSAVGRLVGESRSERSVVGGVAVVVLLVGLGVLLGVIKLPFLLSLLALGGMYVLLTLGLNVHWGYAGLLNFSVAAFWGIGAYSAALLTSPSSPLGLTLHPVAGFVTAVVLSAVVAVLIGIPTLKLREDYLAIASLGLAEVIRLFILNQRDLTAGSQGITGIPRLLEPLPLTQNATNVAIVVAFIAVVYLFLRRIHRSPWGRVVRTIRSDEDLAEALGKDTFAFKMQAFVIGSVIMAIAGAFYVHMNLFIGPGDLVPLTTFYIWVAVILGGTGSNRGAVLGALTVIAIREGTRFLNDVAVFEGIDVAPLRLLFVGLLIVLVIRFREDGLLPPKDELIWPSARSGSDARTTAADGGDGS